MVVVACADVIVVCVGAVGLGVVVVGHPVFCGGPT